MGVGRNLPGRKGVMNVPHDLLPLVISRTATRPPLPSKSKSRPSEPIGRPLPPGWCELKKPKKTPAPPCEAVMAKLPAVESLSLNVLAGVRGAAQEPGLEERWMRPPNSPTALPAKCVAL